MVPIYNIRSRAVCNHYKHRRKPVNWFPMMIAMRLPDGECNGFTKVLSPAIIQNVGINTILQIGIFKNST